MIYICNFFVNKKEAVSNQIELLRRQTNARLFAAGIFMGQKHLDPSDIQDGKMILPEEIYNLLLPKVIAQSTEGIHYFEEEPDDSRVEYFNNSKSNLYISMYRRPTLDYAEHLKKYTNLKKVFVELEEHANVLKTHGIDEEKIIVAHTPGLFQPIKNTKTFDPNNINIVFASWNDGTQEALEDRGLLFLLEILRKNPNISLTIPLRDNNTGLFEEYIHNFGLTNRVNLFSPKDRDELVEMYKNCDFVVFTTKKRVTKDVPNSIIDGILCGKPCIVSKTIDYSKTVEKNNIGIVVDEHFTVPNLNISQDQYTTWSNNTETLANKHTESEYLKIINHYLPSDLDNFEPIKI